MPERFAQSGLGHGSLAVHREYSRDGVAICPSLENYESKVIPLQEAGFTARRTADRSVSVAISPRDKQFQKVMLKVR
jgi:hypothetical protein